MTHDLIKQAQEQAKKGLVKEHDMEGGGDFEYTPPAKGPCFARLISYVETGVHPQRPYQGKPKDPAAEFEAVFQLQGKKHQREYEDKDGNKKIAYPTIKAKGTIKGGPRSAYTKLIKALDYGRGKTMMFEFLGEAFKLNIIHKEEEKDGKKITYANIKDENHVWQIGAPVKEVTDDETGDVTNVPVKVPEASVPLRLFMWDAATIEQWHSIYIEGSYTRKDGDKEVEVSKNALQQKIMSANNWDGSPMQTILAEADGELPDLSLSEDDEDDTGVDLPDEDELDLDGGAGSPDEDDPLAGIDLDDEIPL